MAGQDIVSLGIDISSFTPAKLKKLDDFVIAFDKLEKYDGKTFNPIIGGGLVDFNNSILQTGKLLDELNLKLTQFSTNATSTGTSTKSASAGTKELTAEQAALKVQLAETNRALLEQAKAQNVNVQARETAKKLIKEQFDAETALANQQKADSALITALIKKQTIAETELANQQKKDSATILTLKKQQQQAVDANIAAQKRESAAVAKLSSDYLLLKQAQQDQSVSYSNLYINKGKSNPDTFAALAQYKETSATLSAIEGQLLTARKPAEDLDQAFSRASSSSGGIGRNLTHMLGYLRNIAYILPGIGLAGIFDLAFTAIGNAVNSLGLFDQTTEHLIDVETKLNKVLLEEISNLEIINKAYKEVIDLKNDNIINDQKEIDLQKAFGENQNTILLAEIALAQLREKTTKNNLVGGEENNYKQILESQKRLNSLRVDQLRIDEALQQMQDPSNKNKGLGYYDAKNKDFITDEDVIEKKKKLVQDETQLELDNLKLLTTKYKDYSDARLQTQEKQIQYTKLLADQERKELVEISKDATSVDIDTSNKKLNRDISTEKQKIAALRELNEEQKKIFQSDLFNVTDNKSSTPDEILIAKNKYDPKVGTEVIKANIDTEEKIAKLREDYRQKRLTAEEKIDSDVQEKSAIYNEKTYQDDQNSLSKRLAAYTDYISEKIKLQDIQYKRDIDVLSLKTGDKTAQDQIKALQSERDLQKSNLEADAQKKVYDIVYSSLQKQLKAIKDEHSEEVQYNKEKYIEDLTALNDRLDRKEISIDRYNQLRKKLDRRDQKEVLIQQIADDEQLLAELRKSKQDQIDVEVDFAKTKLDIAKAGGDQYSIDKAQGEYDAALKAQGDFNKAIADGVSKEQADRLKLAKLGGADENKERKKWAEAALEIEKALYESIKKLGDEDYQRRIELIEKRKDLLDQNFQSEQEAIDKSSLSAKDKAALDIQLAAQKQELDNKAAADERQLKIKQFEFDRKLSIGNIIISTAAGIAKAIPDVPKEIAAAAVGAIELATAIAQQPPAYRYGTPLGGHPGGLARYGEAGIEEVREPYKSPYLIMSETISYLPKGTEIIPIKDSPIFGERVQGDGWEQTRWLGSQMRKNNKDIKNIFRPVINIDLGFENYKRSKLYGRS